MNPRPDHLDLCDAADLAITQLQQHVPADHLLSVVSDLRREVLALRRGSDPAMMFQIIDNLPDTISAEHVRPLRRAIIAMTVEDAPL